VAADRDLGITDRDVIQRVADALTSATLLAAYVQRDIIEIPEMEQINMALLRATMALRNLRRR
jgi:hypothetical protein